MLRNISKFISLIAILTIASFIFSSDKAEAATISVASGTDTIAVDSSCSLSEAIGNINDQAVTNADCAAGDGVDDTITLPSGTIMLSADLPIVTEGMELSGTGKTTSTINCDGNVGINTNYAATAMLNDLSIKDLKFQGCSNAAVLVFFAKSVTLSSVDIDNCDKGARIEESQVVVVSNSIFRNNDSLDYSKNTAGLMVSLAGLYASDQPSFSIENTSIVDNSADGPTGQAGLILSTREASIDDIGQFITTNTLTIRNVSVTENTAGLQAAIFYSPFNGPFTPLITEFLIEASTVANNSVDVPTPEVVIAQGGQPVLAGLQIVGNLNSQQNINNVTVANNSINNPAPDNRNTIAGFFGSFGLNSANLLITNATIVNNSVNQPSAGMALSAFNVLYLDLDLSDYPTVVVNEIKSGSSAVNTLIARNTSNGVLRNCLGLVNLSPLGFDVDIDGTPLDLGNNISDDQSCTGYDYSPNLYNTLDALQDNGGPVPTIALLPGSPAIGAAGQVLGISTDARGVPRPSTPDVGAYQTVLGDTTTTIGPASSGGVGVPNSGFAPETSSTSKATIVFIVLSSIALVNILIKRLKNAKESI